MTMQPQHRAPFVPAQRAAEPSWRDASLPIVPAPVAAAVPTPRDAAPGPAPRTPAQGTPAPVDLPRQQPPRIPRQQAPAEPHRPPEQRRPAEHPVHPVHPMHAARPEHPVHRIPAQRGPGQGDTPGPQHRAPAPRHAAGQAAPHLFVPPQRTATPAVAPAPQRGPAGTASADEPDDLTTARAVVLDLVTRIGSMVTLAAVLAVSVSIGTALDGQPASDSAPLTVTFEP